MFFALLGLVVVLTVGGFWVLMLVDCVTHRAGDHVAGRNGSFLPLVLLTGPIGAAIHFFTRVLKRPAGETPTGRLLWVGAVLNGVYHGLALVGLFVMCVFLVPIFVRFLEGVDAKLPYSFLALLQFSGWLFAVRWFAIPVAALMLACDVLLYWAAKRLNMRFIAYIYSTVVGTVLVVTCALSAFAVLASRLSAVDAMSP